MKKFSYSINERMTPRNEFVFNYCGVTKGKRILDIGCGFGWYEKLAIENGAIKIVGIEPSVNNFHQAEKEIPKAKFIIGSADKLPFEKSSFDKAIMLEVLEHLPKGSEKNSLKEIHRVLVKNGEFVLSTPHKHLLSCFLDPAWYFGHRHYSLKQVKLWLEENDFLITDVFIYGGFWELFRMLPHYFFKYIFNAEDPLKRFFENKIKNDSNNPKNFAYIYIKAIKK